VERRKRLAWRVLASGQRDVLHPGRGFLNGGDGGADDVEDAVGLGEHRDVAAVEFVGGGAHALGRGAFEFGVDGVVAGGDDVPARLGPPGGARGVAEEQVGGRGEVGRPDYFLLFGGQVPGEAGGA
jgi:hypothetical protein